ncbi:hypothetical protein Btru_063406 [Bulinus truncatus]|nr:hypothetical protein Btru_063406 [Bulinus truncatus]
MIRICSSILRGKSQWPAYDPLSLECIHVVVQRILIESTSIQLLIGQFTKTCVSMMGPRINVNMLLVILTCVLLHEIFASLVCPEAMVTECGKSLKHFDERVHVNSTRFKINFMCDTKTDGGGWIIIQRRFMKYPTFKRKWADYKNGFGNICKDYWLGNDNIHRITYQGSWELRIDMVFDTSFYHVVYNYFFIMDESQMYKLKFRQFLYGNVGDMLSHHKNMKFSTPDRDNDGTKMRHCARHYQSGWWYGNCHQANLNGIFGNASFGYGVNWEVLTGDHKSLDSVEIKIREINKGKKIKKTKIG